MDCLNIRQKEYVMTKTVNITKQNIVTAKAAIEATDKLDQTVRQSIAAYAKLGKVLKRLPEDRAAFDAALVKLGLRDAKTGKDDKRSTVQRDLFSRDNRSLCVKLADNLPAVNAFLKKQAKTGGKVNTMSGVLSKIAADHRKTKTGGKPQNAKLIQPAGADNSTEITAGTYDLANHFGDMDQVAKFQKLANAFYADCRKLGVNSVDALALLGKWDSEENIQLDQKMAQAS